MHFIYFMDFIRFFSHLSIVDLQCCISFKWASQLVLLIRNLPANAGDLRDMGSTPGQEDPWRAPRTEEPGRLRVHRVAKSWTQLKQLAMLHSTLVSDIQKSESAIQIHTPTLFQIIFPYRPLQSIESSSLCYRVDPYQLSVLYTVVCICQFQSPNLSLHLPFPPCIQLLSRV